MSRETEHMDSNVDINSNSAVEEVLEVVKNADHIHKVIMSRGASYTESIKNESKQQSN